MSLETVFANPPPLVGADNNETGKDKERSSNYMGNQHSLQYSPPTTYIHSLNLFSRSILSVNAVSKGKFRRRWTQKTTRHVEISVVINYDN
jgi:hypothetical protein